VPTSRVFSILLPRTSTPLDDLVLFARQPRSIFLHFQFCQPHPRFSSRPISTRHQGAACRGSACRVANTFFSTKTVFLSSRLRNSILLSLLLVQDSQNFQEKSMIIIEKSWQYTIWVLLATLSACHRCARFCNALALMKAIFSPET